MDIINQYDLDALPYVDNEYDEPYMQAIVNNLILEEMKQFVPAANYLEHLPPLREVSFDNSEALQTAYERAVIASSSSSTLENPDKIDVMKRYNPGSIQNPEGALKNDLQAWRRNVNNAKVQMEYNSNHLMNLEIQAELMQNLNSEPSTGGNGLSAYWLQHVNTLKSVFEITLPGKQNAQKRQIDEINRARYNEQMGVRADLEKLNKRRCAALDNARHIQSALN